MDNFDLKKFLVENKLTYQEKMKEAASSEQAANQAMKVLPQLEKSPEMDKLADKIAKDPNLMKQLEKALSQAGASMNENIGQLDTSDLKNMVSNLAKKGEQVNEEESSNVRITKLGQKEDDGTAVGAGALAFGAGGTLAAMFSSAIGAAVPALATVFAGPAVAGAIAGVALFALARKVYQKATQKPSTNQSKSDSQHDPNYLKNKFKDAGFGVSEAEKEKLNESRIFFGKY